MEQAGQTITVDCCVCRRCHTSAVKFVELGWYRPRGWWANDEGDLAPKGWVAVTLEGEHLGYTVHLCDRCKEIITGLIERMRSPG